MKKMNHRSKKKANDVPRSATYQPGKHKVPMNQTFSKQSSRHN